MIDLFEELGKKTPLYSNKYRKLIGGFAKKAAFDHHEVQEQAYDLGKYFSTFYEFYIYAAFIGLYTNNAIPLEPKDGTKFIEIRAWKPEDVVRYLLMAVISKSDLDFNALEDMDDKGVEREMRKINDLLEAYANGGFDYISSKIEDDRAFFDDDHCFVKLLREI